MNFAPSTNSVRWTNDVDSVYRLTGRLQFEQFAALQAVPFPGTTDEIAEAEVFLASNAVSFITGRDKSVYEDQYHLGNTALDPTASRADDEADLFWAVTNRNSMSKLKSDSGQKRSLWLSSHQGSSRSESGRNWCANTSK